METTIKWLLKNWIFVAIALFVIIVLGNAQCELNKVNRAKQDMLKTDIKTIDSQIKAADDKITAKTDTLSIKGKQAVTKADKLKQDAYKKSTVAPADRMHKHSYLTRE